MPRRKKTRTARLRRNAPRSLAFLLEEARKQPDSSIRQDDGDYSINIKSGPHVGGYTWEADGGRFPFYDMLDLTAIREADYIATVISEVEIPLLRQLQGFAYPKMLGAIEKRKSAVWQELADFYETAVPVIHAVASIADVPIAEVMERIRENPYALVDMGLPLWDDLIWTVLQHTPDMRASSLRRFGADDDLVNRFRMRGDTTVLLMFTPKSVRQMRRGLTQREATPILENLLLRREGWMLLGDSMKRGMLPYDVDDRMAFARSLAKKWNLTSAAKAAAPRLSKRVRAITPTPHLSTAKALHGESPNAEQNLRRFVANAQAGMYPDAYFTRDIREMSDKEQLRWAAVSQPDVYRNELRLGSLTPELAALYVRGDFPIPVIRDLAQGMAKGIPSYYLEEVREWRLLGRRSFAGMDAYDLLSAGKAPLFKEFLAKTIEGRRLIEAYDTGNTDTFLRRAKEYLAKHPAQKKRWELYRAYIRWINTNFEDLATTLSKTTIDARRVLESKLKFPKGVRLLVTPDEYRNEGSEMNHCVGGGYFELRSSFVVALDCNPEGSEETPPSERATAQVSLTGEVKDFRSQRNAPPPDECRALLQRFLKMNKTFFDNNEKSGTVRYNPAKGHLPPLRGMRVPEDMDLYDPREESIRAVARGTGGRWSLAQGAYGKKNDPSTIIQRSWERYQQPDKLVRKRQQYEMMLGSSRQSGPYRVTAEPTRAGVRFFVWPLPARSRKVKAYSSIGAAMRRAAELNNSRRPYAQDLGSKVYTKAELSDWLPPDSVFAGRSGKLSAAGKKELRLRSNPARQPVSKEHMAQVVQMASEGNPIGVLIFMDLGNLAYLDDICLTDVDLSRFEAGAEGDQRFQAKKSDLYRVSFRGANLSGMHAKRCNFLACGFMGADLSNSRFIDCYFNTDTNFSGANLTGAQFTECYVYGNREDGTSFRITLERAVQEGFIPGMDSLP